MSGWKRVYYESDKDGLLLMPYGKFKRCTNCGKSLPRWREEKTQSIFFTTGTALANVQANMAMEIM